MTGERGGIFLLVRKGSSVPYNFRVYKKYLKPSKIREVLGKAIVQSHGKDPILAAIVPSGVTDISLWGSR